MSHNAFFTVPQKQMLTDCSEIRSPYGRSSAECDIFMKYVNDQILHTRYTLPGQKNQVHDQSHYKNTLYTECGSAGPACVQIIGYHHKDRKICNDTCAGPSEKFQSVRAAHQNTESAHQSKHVKHPRSAYSVIIIDRNRYEQDHVQRNIILRSEKPLSTLDRRAGGGSEHPFPE